MKTKMTHAACAAYALGAIALATGSDANADTLKKITDAKKIVMGVRDSGAPLSYTMGSGKYVGYHVELCEKVIAGIRRKLKLPELAVEYQPVTSANRVALVQNGTVDLECGTTTNNLARQKDVAFAVTTFVTEVRMGVNVKSGITSVAQLGGKTVATTTGSTAVKTLRLHKRAASADFKEIYGKDHGETFLLLESGRADAMVIDDNILAGNIATAKNPKDFGIVGETLAVEPIAIMFRKDDPGFKKAVDEQLTGMMKSGELTKTYNRWLVEPIPPRNVSMNLPMTKSLKDLIARPNDNPAESYLAK
ncbi:MAG: amino acid ABC transporter substrate-binding protein [Polaromonas sp.]